MTKTTTTGTEFNANYDEGHAEGTRKAKSMTDEALSSTYFGIIETVRQNPENGYATGLLVALQNERTRRANQ